MIEKVIFRHYRPSEIMYRLDDFKFMRFFRGRSYWKPTTFGGRTECTLVTNAGEEFEGISECSIKDNFNYKIGRDIAYGRALATYWKNTNHA